MKREDAKYPYNDYYIYKIFHSKEKRFYALLIHKYDKTRTTISYARYLMSVHIGRFLSKDEEVDHINEDKCDDRIENLQILSKSDNIKKNNSFLTRKYVELICPICGKHFEIPKNQSYLQKPGYKYNTCSKECSNKMKSFIHKQTIFDSLISNIFVREFEKYTNDGISYCAFGEEISIYDDGNESLEGYTKFI